MFFALAHRVTAYGGVLAARQAEGQQETAGEKPLSRGRGDREVVESTKAALALHPATAGLFD